MVVLVTTGLVAVAAEIIPLAALVVEEVAVATIVVVATTIHHQQTRDPYAKCARRGGTRLIGDGTALKKTMFLKREPQQQQ
jgi:hypothetical protein